MLIIMFELLRCDSAAVFCILILDFLKCFRLLKYALLIVNESNTPFYES